MLLYTFPAIPGWDGMHPAIVHFPIALLLVAPLLLLVSLFMRATWRPWAAAALVMMLLGTLATWLATGSGHAAAQLVDKVQGLEQAIGSHERLGVSTRNAFTILTLVLAVLVMIPAMMRKPLAPAWRISVHALFLVGYLGGMLLLTNTANQGGRLVHDRGVRAMLDAQALVHPQDATGTSGAAPSGSPPAPIERVPPGMKR
jgi:uncharacterized membrane protein